jgi:P2 family phage contractile tail tube protein
MANIQINSITNANIYANGVGFLGRAKEVEIPEAAFKFVDHEALGMVGMTELFAGIEKMEATISWNSVYADALRIFSNPNEPILLQCRMSMRVSNSAGLVDEVPVIATLSVVPKNIPGLSLKQQENVELETKLNVTYYKLEIDGEAITEIDLLANIFKVNGVDLLARYKRNTGA